VKSQHHCKLLLSAIVALACFAHASAQDVTGVPGSPSAKTTIDGKTLPPQPPTFGGVNDKYKPAL
jgi:hypothetical protein